MVKLPTDQAFPCMTADGKSGFFGMTKREAFAIVALQGLLANPARADGYETNVDDAILYADALLEQLEKPQSEKGKS